MSKENATQEMIAVEFLKIKSRICESHDCFDCPIGNKKGGCLASYLGGQVTEEELISIVQKWSEEHPVKTRQSEFLKMFPNVGMCDGVIAINPCDLDTDYEPPKGCRPECSDCRQDYWLAELPEE